MGKWYSPVILIELYHRFWSLISIKPKKLRILLVNENTKQRCSKFKIVVPKNGPTASIEKEKPNEFVLNLHAVHII